MIRLPHLLDPGLASDSAAVPFGAVPTINQHHSYYLTSTIYIQTHKIIIVKSDQAFILDFALQFLLLVIVKIRKRYMTTNTDDTDTYSSNDDGNNNIPSPNMTD